MSTPPNPGSPFPPPRRSGTPHPGAAGPGRTCLL